MGVFLGEFKFSNWSRFSVKLVEPAGTSTSLPVLAVLPSSDFGCRDGMDWGCGLSGSWVSRRHAMLLRRKNDTPSLQIDHELGRNAVRGFVPLGPPYEMPV